MIWYGDSAHVFHVAKSGNDGNGGLAQQYPVALAADAKLTVGGALAAAAAGDTIVVWPGEYDEAVDASAKSIQLIGAHRTKSIITNAGANTVKVDIGSLVQNITIKNTDAGKALTVEDECRVIDCTVLSTGIDAVYGPGAKRLTIKGCYIYCRYDALFIGRDAYIADSLIATDGAYTGTGVARAITSGQEWGSVVIDNCRIYAWPAFDKGISTGPFGTVYTSARSLYALTAIKYVTIKNSVIIASGYILPSSKEGSACTGDAYAVSSMTKLSMDNCIVFAETDSNQASKTAHAFSGIDTGIITNTTINSRSDGASGVVEDFHNVLFYLNNVHYDSSKVGDGATVYTLDNALNTAIPGSPTADSINERVAAIDNKLPSADYLAGTSTATGADAQVDVRKIDGEATNGYNATLKLKQLDIQTNVLGAAAIRAVGSLGDGMSLAGGGENGAGLHLDGVLADIVAAEIAAIPAAAAAAVLAKTGASQGGTWSVGKILNISASILAGKWAYKSGSTSIVEVFDIENGTTVIAEMTFSENSPFRQMSVQI